MYEIKMTKERIAQIKGTKSIYVLRAWMLDAIEDLDFWREQAEIFHDGAHPECHSPDCDVLQIRLKELTEWQKSLK